MLGRTALLGRNAMQSMVRYSHSHGGVIGEVSTKNIM